MNAENLAVWLPFDESTTQDLCGNEWTAYGDPTIEDGHVVLNSGYLKSSSTIAFGEQDFTLRFVFRFNSVSSSWASLFGANVSGTVGNFGLFRINATESLRLVCANAAGQKIVLTDLSGLFNSEHDIEFDYTQADTTLKVFIDGTLTYTGTIDIVRLDRYISFGWNHTNSYLRANGYVSNFLLYDGVALHSADFTPPTDLDYIQEELDFIGEACFAFSADTKCEVINNGDAVLQKTVFTGTSGCYGEAPLGVLAGAETFTIEAKISTTTTANITKTYGGHYCAWEWKSIFGVELDGFGFDDGGLSVNGGKLHFWCSPASAGTDITNAKIVSSDAIVNDGEVHEVAVVSSDGAIDLYCDGVLVAHADNINAKIPVEHALKCAFNNNSNSYLQMDLYEARFWSIARTQEEIFATIDGTEEGLEAWYIPDVNQPEIIPDLTGNARHVTLHNATTEALFEYDFSYDANVVCTVVNAAYTVDYDIETAPTSELILVEDDTFHLTGTAFYSNSL